MTERAGRRLSAAHDWMRTHDPSYVALRRAARAALIMPLLFAIGDKVIGNPELATFVAFGSFAMLLLVDFSGSIRDRLFDQAALGVACACLICLGTLASRTTWLAAVGMAAVGFVILFSGVVSSALAGATTALLLAFILPVSLPGPASAIGDRVAGWGLAALVSLPAIALLWPSPARNPVRAGAIAACRALGDRLRAETAWVVSDGSAEDEEAHRAAVTRADEAIHAMLDLFFATPYRPTGLATDARAVVRLVDELRWLNKIVYRSTPTRHPRSANQSVCNVKLAAARVLDRSAELLDHPDGSTQPLDLALEEMRAALTKLERVTIARLPAEADTDGEGHNGGRRVVSSLDPSFRAQEISFVVDQIAANTERAAQAYRRSWIERLLGRQPEGIRGPLAAAQERAGSYVQGPSLWLHNSLRGAAALSLAVLVADLSSVQHGFWVVFGTLAVLRSNALSTGQNIVRALLGTTVGFAVGGVLVYLIGSNTTMLWVLLPIVILFAGLAPAAISFAAGQAAFTLTLLILFNLIAPLGWKIGLVRVEDVALGCAVSLVVGLLFWPRGAAAAFGRALAQAYVDATKYLADAVAYGVGRCDAGGPQFEPPRAQAARAAAASRRLDDTYRGYLTERGSKPVRLSEITALVSGVAGVRLAADAVLDLWDGDGAHGGDRSAARLELMSASDHMTQWYDHFAASLTGREAVPDPLEPDQIADGRLVEAVARDLQNSDGQATATGIRVIWTGDHLDAVRRLQEMLVEPARTAVSERALDPGDEIRGWSPGRKRASSAP